MLAQDVCQEPFPWSLPNWRLEAALDDAPTGQSICTKRQGKKYVRWVLMRCRRDIDPYSKLGPCTVSLCQTILNQSYYKT